MTYWKEDGTWVVLSPPVLVLVEVLMTVAGQCLAFRGEVVMVGGQVVQRISFCRHQSGKKRSHSSGFDLWAARGQKPLLCLDFLGRLWTTGR